MATLDELQQQMEALRQRVDAITAPPTDYYTQRYSGEQTDRGVEIALGLDPDGTGIVTPEHGGTGADTTQAALAALGAGVRPNELINPGFIDQLNSGPYVGSVYGPDGIVGLSGVTKSLSNGVLTLSSSVASNASAYFLTGITNWADAAGKQVTVSVLTTENELVTLTRTIPADQTVVIGTATSSFGNINLLFSSQIGFLLSVGVPNSQVSIPKDGVKFEFGPNQTLAYKDSEGNWQLLPQPDSSYDAQLLKCLRYQVFYAGSTTPAISQYSNNYLWAVMWLPVPLRTVPVLASGTVGVYGNGASLSTKIDGFAFEYFLKGNLLIIRAVKQSHGLTPVTATIQLNAPLFSANL